VRLSFLCDWVPCSRFSVFVFCASLLDARHSFICFALNPLWSFTLSFTNSSEITTSEGVYAFDARTDDVVDRRP
jgi:hypothetical protein